jgi:hypothetical protein
MTPKAIVCRLKNLCLNFVFNRAAAESRQGLLSLTGRTSQSAFEGATEFEPKIVSLKNPKHKGKKISYKQTSIVWKI